MAAERVNNLLCFLPEIKVDIWDCVVIAAFHQLVPANTRTRKRET